jgi:hypothetical protein
LKTLLTLAVLLPLSNQQLQQWLLIALTLMTLTETLTLRALLSVETYKTTIQPY